MPARVAIVEDNEGTRSSLASLLERAKAIHVVGCYADAESALADAPSRRPDVVLMDIKLPQMNGADCVARMKATLPAAQFIMLTVYADDECVFNSLLAGANGYLLKRTPPARLLEAIRDVRAGGSPMTPEIARRVVQYFRSQSPNPDDLGKLTPREKQVLDQLAQGFRYKEVGGNLNLSMDTVRTHIRNIYDKLRVHSRTEALLKYLKK
ncbi:MAG: response regulator transcription factor [Verrucomicrobiota bacterium]|nr:response regulator transcription factor [Verrucomicrobiota bacterium]